MGAQHLDQRWLLAFAALALALTPLTASSPPDQAPQCYGPGNFLILSADLFAGHLGDFVTLKETQGYAVTVAFLSQIGGTSMENIHTYITGWYAGKEEAPNYLLLVGADENIPVWPAAFGSGTDLYYATMDGVNDYIPDLCYGRLPFRDSAELDRWVGKILAYEQGKAGETWPRRASFIATDNYNNYQAVEAAHETVISRHTSLNFTGSFPTDPQPGGDRLYPRTHGAASADVRDALNAGPALVVYNGLGSGASWLGPVFTQQDVRELTGPPIPLVLSLADWTADFSEIESFADTWMIQPESGALTFIGSSSSLISFGHHIELEKQFFEKLFIDPTDPATLGQALAYGLEMVGTRYPADSRRLWEAYQLFGDPSLQIALEPILQDYELVVTPDSITIYGNGQAQATLQAIGINGFDSPVALTATGFPPGMSVDIDPNSIQPGQTATAVITANGVAPGEYTVIFQGDASGRIRNAELPVTLGPWRVLLPLVAHQ